MRYAVYAVPGIGDNSANSATALRDTAASWFARADMRDITTEPRRYGFHATLKAPFRPASGITQETVIDAVAAFARTHDPVTLRDLRPAAIGEFRALVPHGRTDDVDTLAAATVRELDHLRAPMTAAERTRRRPELLSATQAGLLDRWGYPYVMAEFAVHLTLTNALRGIRIPEVDSAIAAHFAAVTGADVAITALTVCAEPEPGADFHPLHVQPLRSTIATPTL